MQSLVVVSGLPASGKTTLAAALAASLQLPFFDKDSFLEALFRSEGAGSAAWRRELSKRADAQFQDAAAQARSAVLASWWKHPNSVADSGTPVEWLAIHPATPIEVHCVCRPAVAAARFMARKRHPGHLDGKWSQARLLELMHQQHALGPLFPASAITVNTEQPIQLQELVHTVEAKVRIERDA